MLSYFYDAVAQPWGCCAADTVGSALIWTPPGAELTRRDAPVIPGPFDEPEPPFTPCAASGVPAVFPPPPDEVDGWPRPPDPYADWHMAELERIDPRGFAPLHRVGGHPVLIEDEIGSDLVRQREALTDESARGDWILLLRVGSDDEPGFQWGDWGHLSVWIDGGDLAARRFDRALTILQCS